MKKNILSTHYERIKKQLRTEYKEKSKKVKRSIRSDKRKCMDGFASDIFSNFFPNIIVISHTL